MSDTIVPYILPDSVKSGLLDLAGNSDLLIIGEVHGTQEVPRVVLSLLTDLAAKGYGALAMEMPESERDQLLQCLAGEAMPPLLFEHSDFRDGRGNVQALSLLVQAAQMGWQILCFDVAPTTPIFAWADRDRGMSENLLAQWEQDCPGRKVLAVCGNFHSRLVPPTEHTEFWPSFAYSVQQSRPNLAVSSVNVVFHGGEFYNGEVRAFGNGGEPNFGDPELRPANRLGHTIDLHLPHATAATFLDGV